MFSLFDFYLSAINTQTAHITLGLCMKATFNPSLPHIQAFIEMFASLVFGSDGLANSAFHSGEFPRRVYNLFV